MDNSYNIKVKKGSLEIEVSGPEKEFVSDKFKEVLDKLEESEVFKTPEIIESSTKILPEKVSQPTVIQTEVSGEASESGQSLLAKAAGVSEEDLSNIYDFKGGEILIHKEIKGSDAERQKTVAKLALIANEYIKGVSELSGKALGKYMKELAIGSMANLAVNLKREKGIIKVRNYYKLNAIGKKEALDLIKNSSMI